MFFLKIFLLIIGVFEIISNLFHISKGSIDAIGVSAKRQHQEIPGNSPNFNFFIKAIIMFIFGIVFTVSGIVSLLVSGTSILVLISTSMLSLYGVIQAVIYRKCKSVWGAMVVYSLPLIIFLVVK